MLRVGRVRWGGSSAAAVRARTLAARLGEVQTVRVWIRPDGGMLVAAPETRGRPVEHGDVATKTRTAPGVGARTSAAPRRLPRCILGVAHVAHHSCSSCAPTAITCSEETGARNDPCGLRTHVRQTRPCRLNAGCANMDELGAPSRCQARFPPPSRYGCIPSPPTTDHPDKLCRYAAASFTRRNARFHSSAALCMPSIRNI